MKNCMIKLIQPWWKKNRKEKKERNYQHESNIHWKNPTINHWAMQGDTDTQGNSSSTSLKRGENKKQAIRKRKRKEKQKQKQKSTISQIQSQSQSHKLQSRHIIMTRSLLCKLMRRSCSSCSSHPPRWIWMVKAR